jgi:hypothetical protein
MSNPDLASLACAEHHRGVCTQIGTMGEEMVAELLVERYLPYRMTDHDCPVDFILPTRRYTMGVEVKTSLSGYHHVNLKFEAEERRKKSRFCKRQALVPMTILVWKVPDDEDTFRLFWKPGIKRFEVERMKPLEEFLDSVRTPSFVRGTARCATCGRFVASRTQGRPTDLRVWNGAGYRTKEFQELRYDCPEHGRGRSWRETG